MTSPLITLQGSPLYKDSGLTEELLGLDAISEGSEVYLKGILGALQCVIRRCPDGILYASHDEDRYILKYVAPSWRCLGALNVSGRKSCDSSPQI